MNGVITDITSKREAEAKLRLAIEVYDYSEQMIFVASPVGRIIDANPAVYKATGFGHHEIIGKHIGLLAAGDDARLQRKILKTLHTKGLWEGEFPVRNNSGTPLHVLLTINRVQDTLGETSRFICTASDITRLKEVESQLRSMAYFDTLTTLPNRQYLLERLRQVLAENERRATPSALMSIDLDNFKDINDTLGHQAGDTVLCHVGQILKKSVRRSDSVARMGGDEFVILLRDIPTPENAALVAQKILDALAVPVTLNKVEVYVGASIGIAFIPDDGVELYEMLQKADAAMYYAKRLGKNSFHYYSEEMNANSKKRLALLTDLHRAIERDEFIVHYQPKVDIRTGIISGAETLVRWNSPNRGMVSPSDFIPLAEESGLVVPMGEMILKTACRQAAEWQRQRIPHFTVGVNLSALQFWKHDLFVTIQRILDETGLNPQLLELEITETGLMHNPDAAAHTLGQLKDIGIGHITMDDFGTGFSSLSYLKRFPVDTLKIDQSFIRDIHVHEGTAEIVRAIIAMAHRLNLKVVAEGAETDEQMVFLRYEECDEVQGYYFSRPLPEEQFSTMLLHNRQFDVSKWYLPQREIIT